MNRRDVLKSAAALAGWSSFWARQVNAGPAAGNEAGTPDDASSGQTRKGDMIYRSLGKTGEQVSVIGVGGHHIGLMDEQKDAVRLIRSAIDAGITFMDNSWDYHAGKSERWMGKALEDGYRDKVFLMTKLDGRTKDYASKQIDESLDRLEVDHVDLMQIHEVIRLEDPDLCFAKKGCVEALREAKKAGKIRYVGFTGHKDPYVHNRMLELAARNDFHFDTVQMPLNVLDATFRSFAQHTLPKLVEQQIGVLGMKPMASGAIVREQLATPQECLRYAMTLPTAVVIAGMDSMDRLKQNLEIVRNFKPLGADEMKDLLTRVAPAADTGRYEGFKTTAKFDATAQNPEWLG